MVLAQTQCQESKEEKILPVLVEFQKNQPAHHAAKHAGAERADDIPREYAVMPQEELDAHISAAREILGNRLTILGHHYQREEVIKYADERGDSFKLAQFAAAHPEAEYILFCGVHFMAESADILSGEHQKVILPNPAAGCSMADMANIAEVEECWDYLQNYYQDADEDMASIIPITYMNSTADIKGFCGRNGGIVCTSSNAKAVLEWAFERGKRVLFFPDEHLGRNTGYKMGISESEMVVWNPRDPFGADIDEHLDSARIILWKGFCSTHQRFTVQQVQKARQEHPDIKVIVHPECRHEVVEAADLNGSTEYIIKQIEASSSGSKWAVGTEINLVHRLAVQNPDKLVFCLDPVVCPCSTMYRIHPAYLAWVMDGLVEGRVINQVTVDKDVAHWARIALDRMLATKGK